MSSTQTKPKSGICRFPPRTLLNTFRECRLQKKIISIYLSPSTPTLTRHVNGQHGHIELLNNNNTPQERERDIILYGQGMLGSILTFEDD